MALLELILKSNENVQKLRVHKSTHIGRFTSSQGWIVKAREQPLDISQLELNILIQNPGVSRNHAAIILENDKYVLYDLNSKNGTWHDLDRIKSVVLEPGIKFSLASARHEVDFEVVKHERVHEDGKVKQALLVFTGEDNAGACAKEKELLYSVLKTRRNYDVEVLMSPGIHELTYKLDEFAGYLVDDDDFYLHIKGHGNSEGLYFGQGSILKPKDLYAYLDNIRARKAVVLDSCRSGNFLKQEYADFFPDNTMILTSANNRELAYEQLYPELSPVPISRFTAAMVRFLEQKKKVNLKEFMDFLSLAEQNELQLYEQKPRQRAHSYGMSVVASRNYSNP